MIRFRAHFDGEHLTPDEPVDLPRGTPLEVTVEEAAAAHDAPPLNLKQFFDEIEAKVGLFDGPEDLSAQLDHYLYGAPKRSDADGV
jgi:hypothetical protein